MRRTGLILTIFGLIPVLVYGGLTLAFRMDAIGFGAIFGTFGWLVPALGLGGVAAIVGAGLMVFQRAVFPAFVSVLVGVVAFAMAAGPVAMKRTAAEVPPIHDITTDTDDPPAFVAIAPLRADAPNPAEYDRSQAEAQRAYYGLAPALIERPYPDVFADARAALEAEGLRVVAAAPREGRLEAVATTRWFGFEDDVVMRLRDVHGRATIVDVRSKSRVGRSDLGANAARIEAILARIDGAGQPAS